MNVPRLLPAPPVDGLARHQDYLRARLRGLGVSGANLDDAVQDVFEVLIRRIGDYDSRFSLRQWMAGVARKVARRHREHERCLPGPVDERTTAARTPDPEHTAARQQGLAVLQRFLADLDADRWAVFVLSEIEGLRGTEIAAELNVNLSTVYARLRTARQAFEAAAAAQRGPGRSWLGSLFAAPTALFRRTSEAAFTTPLVLVALGTVGLGAAVGTRSCADVPEDPEQVAQPVGSQTPRPGLTAQPGGIRTRAADPARLVEDRPTRDGPPVADARGWFDGGAGTSDGDAAWSHKIQYRLDGSDLFVRIEYSSDGDAATQWHGWIEPDGFDVVEGATDWPIELAVGEDRTLHWHLRANRPGVVHAPFFDGRVQRVDNGGHLFRFVHERGQLRHCRDAECATRVPSIQPYLSGTTIPVHLRNDCDQAIDIVLLPPQVEVVPPDAPVHHLVIGERLALEVDRALAFARRHEDGHIAGTIASDSPGAIIRFSGETCDHYSADSPKP